MTEQAQNINPEEVLAALNSTDLDSVRHAVFAAGELGLTETIDVLCKHIQSKNIGIQEAAEYALRKIRGTKTIQKILPLLRSESPSLRNIAMDILREIGCDDIASIQSFLRDPDPDLRIFMADILGYTKNLKSVPLLCEALLKDPEVNVRYQAAMSLGHLGYPEAIDALQQAMNDEEWVQFSVVEALIKINAEDTASVLVKYLDDCSLLVASVIIDALGEAKILKAVPLLLGYLEKANPILHPKAVKAIVRILGEGSLSLLSQAEQARFKTYLDAALEDEDDSVQFAALAGLRVVGDAESSQAVINFIEKLTVEPEEEIYVKALTTLASIGYNETFAAFFNSDNERIVHIALEACQLMDNPACIEVITNIFWDIDRDSQRLAMMYISKFAVQKHAEFILDVLERVDDSEVQKACMDSLGEKLQYAPAQDKIFSMIEHPYGDVKESALVACVYIHTPELEEKFLNLFSAEDEDSRVIAIYALSNFGVKEHFNVIMRALDDESPAVRQIAVESFASEELNLREHIDTLLKMLNDPVHDVRIAVVDVLGNANDDFVTPYLVNALDDKNEWVCIRAIEALARFDSEKIAPLMVGLLSHATPMVTFKIIEVLAEIGGNVAFSALLGLMSSEDSEIQHAATVAIEKIQAGQN